MSLIGGDASVMTTSCDAETSRVGMGDPLSRNTGLAHIVAPVRVGDVNPLHSCDGDGERLPVLKMSPTIGRGDIPGLPSKALDSDKSLIDEDTCLVTGRTLCRNRVDTDWFAPGIATSFMRPEFVWPSLTAPLCSAWRRLRDSSC